MRFPLLPLAALFVIPLGAAQAKPAARPGVQPGLHAIGPKPDDPARGRQGREDGMKPTGGKGPQAIGPKPDDPRQAKPAQAVPKADPRKDGVRR